MLIKVEKMNFKYMRLIVLLAAALISGAVMADQNRGRQLWNSIVNDRSCTSCHGDEPSKMGKHIKTGKIIQPMALSVNSERFRDDKKIEKWLLRNCKWTFGRPCSTQEKADIISWLSNQ